MADLVRIVRMTFQPEKVNDFLHLFEDTKDKIRSFQGCTHLTLYADDREPNIMMTYSHWKAASDLENYRHSELFKNIWARTKPLFASKPQAFSMVEKSKTDI